MHWITNLTCTTHLSPVTKNSRSLSIPMPIISIYLFLSYTRLLNYVFASFQLFSTSTSNSNPFFPNFNFFYTSALFLIYSQLCFVWWFLLPKQAAWKFSWPGLYKTPWVLSLKLYPDFPCFQKQARNKFCTYIIHYLNIIM